MYIGIDVGGTKTLVCVLTNEGIIRESFKFPTPADYDEWRQQLKQCIRRLSTQGFVAGCIAIPGTIDREKGTLIHLGNLGWENIPIVHDVHRIIGCPTYFDNDAKLGGLSEALLLKHTYSRVLYVTISTGIGIGLVVDQKIDEAIGDGGGRTMLLEHEGNMIPWETFGSGKHIVEKYGKMASEIDDPKIWAQIVKNFTPGFLELVATLNPEVIVVGGGAGHYLAKFHDFLVEDLKQYETSMLHIPPIVPAGRPDEAVAYGCYDYAKQKHEAITHTS
jgi:predicted NBD/HSP70 family sugar kinase